MPLPQRGRGFLLFSRRRSDRDTRAVSVEPALPAPAALQRTMPVENEHNKTPALPIVCIADPDEGLARRLADLLEPLGTQVRAYASGQLLLEDIAPGALCVVSESQLPDMTGIQLIDSLRGLAPGVPVILLATDGDVAAAVAAMRAGALDFIEKPHVERLVVWRVRHLLENDRPAGESG